MSRSAWSSVSSRVGAELQRGRRRGTPPATRASSGKVGIGFSPRGPARGEAVAVVEERGAEADRHGQRVGRRRAGRGCPESGVGPSPGAPEQRGVARGQGAGPFGDRPQPVGELARGEPAIASKETKTARGGRGVEDARLVGAFEGDRGGQGGVGRRGRLGRAGAAPPGDARRRAAPAPRAAPPSRSSRRRTLIPPALPDRRALRHERARVDQLGDVGELARPRRPSGRRPALSSAARQRIPARHRAARRRPARDSVARRRRRAPRSMRPTRARFPRLRSAAAACASTTRVPRRLAAQRDQRVARSTGSRGRAAAGASASSKTSCARRTYSSGSIVRSGTCRAAGGRRPPGAARRAPRRRVEPRPPQRQLDPVQAGEVGRAHAAGQPAGSPLIAASRSPKAP